jgi:phospholipid transport system transporter-binding protein
MIERDGNGLHLRGAITVANVAELCEAGKAQLADGDKVDLSGVTEVDSSALSLIFEWQREAARRKLKLTFGNHPDSLKSLAELYGVADLVSLPKA